MNLWTTIDKFNEHLARMTAAIWNLVTGLIIGIFTGFTVCCAFVALDASKRGKDVSIFSYKNLKKKKD